MNMSYAKMDIRKTLTTGVAPPRLSKTGSPEYIGKVAGCPVDIRLARSEDGSAYDSIRDYFNLYRYISIADVLWKLDCPPCLIHRVSGVRKGIT